MKKKLKKRWIVAVLLLCALTLTWRGLEEWNYAGTDSIERMRIDTEYKLAHYNRSEDTAEMHDWLVNDSTDGAPETQKYLTLSNWAREHPQQFVKLIESLPPSEQSSAIESFSYAIESPKTRQQMKEILHSCCTYSVTSQRILRAL